ncbi:MAG: hypothetical protein OXP36_00680, partial [Gammaproteobacteria bacterium]|nr:hypothetical protein [Gammaproteobacteria bacterium]
MTTQVESTAQIRLQRLWKGTLFVGIGGGYVLLVALLFVYHGWQAALLAVFLIGVSQFFRYIANDVDRIGWRMSNESDESAGDTTKRYQGRMLVALAGLVQALNLALIYQAYHLGGLRWMLPMLIGLVLIEVLYSRIRSVNRRIEFEEASYGFKDRGPLTRGPEAMRASNQARLDRKLEELKTLADEGLISRKAYEKARDKHRI